MSNWIAALLLLPVLIQQPSAEARIIEYLSTNLEPGRRTVVSDLLNDVFTSAEEREALDRLYDIFFKIPLYVAEHYTVAGRPPSLEDIATQYHLTVPGEAEVLLRVMEAEPRIPKFFERDTATKEIVSVDVEAIQSHPQFGRALERTIAGWEGAAEPAFRVETFDGRTITSDDFVGRSHMVYVWYSNCPPCVQTTPILKRLHEQYAPQGFEIVAANADRVLELPYDDEDRNEYVNQEGIPYLTVHLSAAMQQAFGGVNVFPTMFFVDPDGIIARHFVNYQEEAVLEEAIQATLK